MGTISTAVGSERISRVSGYNIKKGFFSKETPNLPQIIAVFGEANTPEQTGLTTTKREVTSSDEAGILYGYGSPIHRQMCILRPKGDVGVGGIPTIVFPQVTAGGATASTRVYTVTGTATKNTTHSLVVNGRYNLDFKYYSYDIVVGDTPTIIAGKMKDAMNAVLGAPAIGANTAGVVTFTSKWKGLTSAQLNVYIDLGDETAGLSYSQTSSTNGAGSVDLSASLAQFGDDWYTIVLNPYGEAQLDVLEQFNGLPNDTNPTGRYSGLVFKPFCAYFGNTSSNKNTLATITDDSDRVEQVTNVLCVAPASDGFNFEASANVVALVAVVFQNNPNLDVNNLSYPDMPIPTDGVIGEMSDYNTRDYLVKKGCSTVTLVKGDYRVQDLVTTYHPAGETPLLYSYPRTLNIHWNVKDTYITLEALYLRDKTLVSDTQLVNVDGCIKPSEWKGIVYEMFDNLAEKALLKDSAFSKQSLQVQISTTNPNRFETAFDYKTTGIARIESTTVKAGF
jgi:phage tail sheath gpL-like